jgi:hypothetical protein
MPSVDDIRVKAFPIPEYTAAGEVANTCIRVYIAEQKCNDNKSDCAENQKKKVLMLTLMLSIGNIKACSDMPA